MKTSRFQLVAYSLCIACACLALPSPAHAGKMDGIMYLVAVTQMKASNANDDALAGAEKQRVLLGGKQKVHDLHVQLEGAAPQQDDAPEVSHAGLIMDDVAAIADFGSKAGADGLDAAERKSLAELVAVAQQRVDGAIADASTAIVGAKKLLKETEAADDKASIKLQLKSLRVIVKAHKQTAAALRAVAKKLAA